MPLNATVKTEVIKNTEKHEGRVPHLYLDTRGFVTVGIGHLIPNKSAMASVPLYKKGANNVLVLASLAEKHAEDDTIKKQPYGKYLASYYKPYTTLVMKDHDIVIQKEKHIASFYRELVGYYNTKNGFSTHFDAMPFEVQQALLDMSFNLGITRLKNQYINMNAHIKKEKWGDAALQSNRIGIQAQRNLYIKNLFLKAQASAKKP